jgi:hypothetical protein
MEHIVRSGDCMLSIAHKYGLLWETLWNANFELRRKRNNPNVLFPGDVVEIPERTPAEFLRPTDQKHVFVLHGTEAKFRLILERSNIPLAHRRFILIVDGKSTTGKTDATGFLEVSISPSAREGKIVLPDDRLECALDFGYLDPIEEPLGVQQRLQNLGFYHGALDGRLTGETRTAITDFQSSVCLEATGDLTQATRDKLLLMHDQPHPQASADAGQHQESLAQAK